jgi:hypothetical protein
MPIANKIIYSVAGNSCPTCLNRSKILKKKTIRKIINKFRIIYQTLLDRYVLSIYYAIACHHSYLAARHKKCDEKSPGHSSHSPFNIQPLFHILALYCVAQVGRPRAGREAQ